MKEYSPFTPGNPVPREFFVGREKQINEILKYANQSTNGRLESVFLSGDRGIGKSSLASVLRYFLQKEKNFLGLHIFLGGVSSLDEMVRRIFESIYNEANKKKWFDKISGYFGGNIEKVGLFGIDVTFKPNRKDLDQIVKNFPQALHSITEKIKTDKNAIFIILDDINGFCKTPEFANWYKSYVDYVASHQLEFPVFMMVIGLPEIRDSLSEHQPSLMRIFRVVDIEGLRDDEVSEFFKKAFDSADFNVEDEAMQAITQFSNGLPILMQEIGDAIFWNATDDVVTKKIALEGIIEAAGRIGKKYLDPKVYRAIRSEHYRSILRHLGMNLKPDFQKSAILKNLKVKEQKVFDNFLKRMIDLGIIVRDLEKGRGYYKFVNVLYFIYIMLESVRYKKKET